MRTICSYVTPHRSPFPSGLVDRPPPPPPPPPPAPPAAASGGRSVPEKSTCSGAAEGRGRRVLTRAWLAWVGFDSRLASVGGF